MRLSKLSAIAVGLVVVVLVAGCGGSDSTATPVPPTATRPAPTPIPPTATAAPSAPTVAPSTPTPAPVATATSAPAATATRPAPTATAAPAPTPTPAVASVPTPVVVSGAKKGGILQLIVQSSYLLASDTISSRAGVPVYNLLLNNLIWQDPYGDGKAIVGDVAERWAFSNDGTVLTFNIRKGISFHDGKPLTAKDVAYNLDRAWKPRSPAMIEFKGKLDAIKGIETPDDSTLRVTLTKPSNFMVTALAFSTFLVYPASTPFPEMDSQWRESPVGSGPFKWKTTLKDTRMETLRNDKYWKPALPHLDGVTLNAINDSALIVASYRTGKADATSLDFTPLQRSIIDSTLQREQRFVPQKANSSAGLIFTQKDPWTNPKVREAVDLAVNRQDIVTLGFAGLGTPFAGPLLPPELGGQWGYSMDVMSKRPGYREDKTQDIARAKQLLSESGVDLSKVTVRILVSDQLTSAAEALDSSLRAVGFKTQVMPRNSAALIQALMTGDFDVDLETLSMQADDPSDILAQYAGSNGGRNFGKWSDPVFDRLLEEQDGTLDTAKRAQLLKALQDRVLEDRYVQVLLYRWVYVGANGYVKNYVTAGLPFIYGSRFRWEQVWLDR